MVLMLLVGENTIFEVEYANVAAVGTHFYSSQRILWLVIAALYQQVTQYTHRQMLPRVFFR
ncbi:putative heptose 1-phosphate adenyltransferase [Rosellinia necatrix]|uniref:Putative heptose 1-phosphate adenyltransferase n=1 Tax=Rosellinia necatrix TaxID=77044 RepID=A0A1S8AA42_ROSNE|nr:putative heptose 1-phosphate adenyltransferase [Rosellinia necatrix]